MTLEQQLKTHFGLKDIIYKHLNTPTNDVVVVTASTGRFALKLYNPQSRGVADVEWEIGLINHLVQNGAPVVRPICGQSGYVETFILDGQERAVALFEWAAGEKPQPGLDTYTLLGQAAAYIHKAANTFTSPLFREEYNAETLIDEQLERMKPLLLEAKKWQHMVELGARLKQRLANPELDYGICHMDLTLDNVHRDGDTLTVFDFDSAGESWRAIEPWGVKKFSEDYFKAWLEGYRSVRSFSQADEQTVASFSIVGDIRNVVWKLGFAKSSRGKPLLTVADLPGIVDGWLEWEQEKTTHTSRKTEL